MLVSGVREHHKGEKTYKFTTREFFNKLKEETERIELVTKRRDVKSEFFLKKIRCECDTTVKGSATVEVSYCHI